MKKFLPLLLILLSTFSAFSQGSAKQDSAKVESTAKKTAHSAELAAKKSDLDKKFAKYSRDHFVLDLNGANWIYNPNDLKMDGMRTKWFSRGLNIYFNWDFRIKGSRVSIAPGFGYSNYTLYNRHKLNQDTSGIHYTPLSYGSDTTAKINSFTLQYLEVPVEVRIRSNPDKTGNCWKVVVGVKAGLRIDVHTRIKLIEDGETQVFVVRRYSDFNPFRFGPTIRVGYSFFNITAYYGVLNMFKAGLGPTAHEFSLGISFMAL